MTIVFPRALTAAALLLGGSIISNTRAQSAPTFDIDWHLISSGGTTLVGGTSRSSCFIVNGTVGQAAPGYSSGGVYSLYAGFWTAAPTMRTDEIFFDGFEGCTP
jgi:hypothetical protein